ncbi:porin family protein [Roseovarius sp. LXJ103]|uniref:outer membrane protein n=1 Tax=Roseovarius carneus TaxID=2853164 RepID=UPI000D61C609|nr:porin family protein [Roseovarius carneus]MBZ8118854.1 porin family protein [Roseovarius carneus]PWE35483.1 porin family protein [Pelagicola sp. LXJ1103]
MKTTFAIAAAAMIAAGPALAGSKAEPVMEPALAPVAVPPAPTSPDWTGFYAGGQLGYATVDTNVAGVDGDGVIGGLTVGYDYDFGQWVIGAGADYDWTDVSLNATTDLDSVWRLKLRGGYKIGNGLLYGTGGYAQADTNSLGSDDGYFVGAGYEHLVAQNISLGAEVLYHEFDNFNNSTLDVEATTVQARATFRF